MNRILRTALLTMTMTFLMATGGATVARACPNCKEAVSLGAEETANAASGYNWSVVFMIVVPFSMMGTGALAIVRAAKRGYLPEL